MRCTARMSSAAVCIIIPFEGIVENLERRFRETNSEWMKEEIGSFMSGVECPDCHGKRLKPVVLAVTIGV